jgi:SAM-dependent methyltransferase
MEGYDHTTYGERTAPDYDQRPEVLRQATGDAVACLADLARTGPTGAVLELGVGTGRLALPLAERGLEVVGIDASEAMVARLRAKPGGDRVRVVLGDFAAVPAEAPGGFGLVFVAFNTFFALGDQDAQTRCFEAVARALAPGGRFVVEGFVPDLTRWRNHQALTVTWVALDEVRLDASRHDPVAQRVEAQHLVIRADRTLGMTPVVLRYAWPSELDLMARLAGLRLEARWGGWDRRPFDASSTSHVSVYRDPHA